MPDAGTPPVIVIHGAWLAAFQLQSLDVVTPKDFAWQWPASFMDTGLTRLLDLGAIERNRETAFRQALDAVANTANMRMVTPGLLEVIARKTG